MSCKTNCGCQTTNEAQAQPATVSTTSFSPRVDVFETEHEFLVHADIPGVQPGDIHLNFEKGQLSLHGKVNAGTAQPNSLLREYAVGDYHRTFALNDDVDPGKISADYKHGVLTVKLPKREELKPRKIEITV
ncbi:MAG: Hsp20/alpha crystallin family protein [Gemmatales bacterium]